MELYLLRHGIAVERGTPGIKDDGSRPLTSKGRKQLIRSAAALRKLKIRFDLILSSPLVRAQQTAEVVAAELKLRKRLKFSDSLKPGGDAKMLVAELNGLDPRPESVVLVGHEPDLSALISLFVTGRPQAGFALSKGGLAKLDITGKLTAGRCATLAWLLTPKLMKRMG